MKFKTHIQAKLYLIWINFWIPIRMIWEGKHLRGNGSFIAYNFMGVNDNKWTVFKQFITQELIDDLKKHQGMDIVAELESAIVTNEDRKQKLDWMLDDEPIPPDPLKILSNKIEENIKKELNNYKNKNHDRKAC